MLAVLVTHEKKDSLALSQCCELIVFFIRYSGLAAISICVFMPLDIFHETPQRQIISSAYILRISQTLLIFPNSMADFHERGPICFSINSKGCKYYLKES